MTMAHTGSPLRGGSSVGAGVGAGVSLLTSTYVMSTDTSCEPLYLSGSLETAGATCGRSSSGVGSVAAEAAVKKNFTVHEWPVTGASVVVAFVVLVCRRAVL